MKKYIILGIIVFFPIIALSQNPAIEKLFQKYNNSQGVTVVDVTPDMFSMLGGDSKDKEFNDLLENIKSVKVLTIGKKNQKGSTDSKTLNEFKKDVEKNINISEYTKLMEVKNDGNHVRFLTKKSTKNPKNITEFLMIVLEDDNATIIHIVGDVELKKLLKLSKVIGIQGFDEIERLKE